MADDRTPAEVYRDLVFLLAQGDILKGSEIGRSITLAEAIIWLYRLNNASTE